MDEEGAFCFSLLKISINHEQEENMITPLPHSFACAQEFGPPLLQITLLNPHSAPAAGVNPSTANRLLILPHLLSSLLAPNS